MPLCNKQHLTNIWGSDPVYNKNLDPGWVLPRVEISPRGEYNLIVYNLISTPRLRWIDSNFSSLRGELSWRKVKIIFQAIHQAS